MATPVATDDMVQGCVKMLETKSDLLDLLGYFPGPLLTRKYYLFQDKIGVVIEDKPATAIVISAAGPFGAPNVHNTLRALRLSVEIYCGPFRDETNGVIEPAETRRRLNQAFEMIDKYLHRARGGDEMWGTVRTIGSQRLGDIDAYPVPDGDGTYRAQAHYGVLVG